MAPVWDAIVVGLGAHGSAALYHLASRGLKVLGLERFTLAHAQGSSHGLSRIIRTAYMEGGAYVPLLREAWGRWRELERRSGAVLLRQTGCLSAAGPGLGAASCFAGALESARRYCLQHEVLGPEEVLRRHPAYRLPPGFQVLHETQAGTLHPEECIRAHVDLARHHGAEVLEHAQVESWEALPAASGGLSSGAAAVEVRTAGGGRLEARALVLAAGGWMGGLAPELGPLLQVERQVVVWLRPPPEAAADFGAVQFPVFLLQDGEGYLYGFPVDGHGIKFGLYHHLREHGTADELDRTVAEGDVALLRSWAERYWPALQGAAVGRAEACLFTNTPDGHFLVDRHPRHPQVVLCSACSGHGFKFAPVIGAHVADLVQGQRDPSSGGQRDMSLHVLDPRRPGHTDVLAAFAAADAPAT